MSIDAPSPPQVEVPLRATSRRRARRTNLIAWIAAGLTLALLSVVLIQAGQARAARDDALAQASGEAAARHDLDEAQGVLVDIQGQLTRARAEYASLLVRAKKNTKRIARLSAEIHRLEAAAAAAAAARSSSSGGGGGPSSVPPPVPPTLTCWIDYDGVGHCH